MYHDTWIKRTKENIYEIFEHKECDKGAKITADIMEVDM